MNQDPLGIQAVKVAINGTLTPQFVGIAPCSVYESDPHYPDNVPGTCLNAVHCSRDPLSHQHLPMCSRTLDGRRDRTRSSPALFSSPTTSYAMPPHVYADSVCSLNLSFFNVFFLMFGKRYHLYLGPNGVTKSGLVFTAAPIGKVGGTDAYKLIHNATGRCVGMRQYVEAWVPMLVDCVDDLAQDSSQASDNSISLPFPPSSFLHYTCVYKFAGGG